MTPVAHLGELKGSTVASLTALLRSEQARASKRKSASTKNQRHYPPDQLSSLMYGGHAWDRFQSRSPSMMLALSEALPEPVAHVIYHAKVDHLKGNCFHPVLVLRIHEVLADALKLLRAAAGRSGYPAYVAIERGRCLHLHLVTSPAAHLPEKIEVYCPNSGELLVLLVRSRRRYKHKMPSVYENLRYLFKLPFAGAEDFDPSLPATSTQQPRSFQKAMKAFETAREACQAMGLNRLPRRRFGLYVPRLTFAQRRAALQAIEAATEAASGEGVLNITPAEWAAPALQILAEEIRAARRARNSGARTPTRQQRTSNTPKAQERLRQIVNLLLERETGGQSIRALLDAHSATKVKRATLNDYGRVVTADLLHRIRQQVHLQRQHWTVRQTPLWRALAQGLPEFSDKQDA